MEKFALLNLLKALETLSPQKKTEENGNSGDIIQHSKPEAPPQNARKNPDEAQINVMSSVLERHEEIANRIKNNRR